MSIFRSKKRKSQKERILELLQKNIMKKTPIQEIFENNRGLSERIAQHNKKVKNKIVSLHAETVRKAVRGEKVNFNTKFEIMASLVDLGVIKQGEYTTKELFLE